MSLHRRDFLKWGAAAGASLIPGAKALAQAPRTRTPESTLELLMPLLANPQWRIPQIDTSDAGLPGQGKKFDELQRAHDQYYSREPGRGYLHAGINRLLENNGEHLKMIMEKARHYGVPKDIVYLALAESHWKPFGENRALAAGYWQFIPATARLYGLNVPAGEDRTKPRAAAELVGDDRLDPVKSTDAAMRYLSYLKRFFVRVMENHNKKPENASNQITTSENDLWTFAMWAYNRGPGHVRKTFIQTQGNPLLYPLTLLGQPVPGNGNAAVITAARRESAGYVPKIAAIAAHVARFARATPPARHVPEKAPPKEAPKAAPPAPVAPEPPQEVVRESDEDIEFIEYTVQGGDNLTKIATWISPDPDFVQLRMDQIWEANPQIHDRPRYTIRRGEKLLIPAQTVEVTRRGPAREVLPEFARKYYPGWPASGLNMLRFLNGIRDVNEILPQKDARGRPKKLKVPLQNS